MGARGVANLRANRRKFLKSVALGAAIGYSSGGVSSQAASELSARLEKLDKYVNKAMRAWNVPGLAIGVVKDGRLVHSKGYGLRQLGHGDSVDEKQSSRSLPLRNRSTPRPLPS